MGLRNLSTIVMLTIIDKESLMTETTASPAPSGRTAARAAGLAEKVILGFIAGAALAVAVVDLVFVVQHVIGLATEATITLNDVVLADPLHPDLGSPAVGATVVDAVTTLDVTGAPSAARGWLIAATVVGSLLTLGICVVLAWLCLRVFLGKPFVRSATWGIGTVAILVILAGAVAPVLTAVGHAEVASALGIDAMTPFLVEINLAPWGWAAALAVVAGAFELGQRLQHDTDGLV